MKNFLQTTATIIGIVALMLLSLWMWKVFINWQIDCPEPRNRVLIYPDDWRPGGTSIYTIKGDTVWVSRPDSLNGG